MWSSLRISELWVCIKYKTLTGMEEKATRMGQWNGSRRGLWRIQRYVVWKRSRSGVQDFYLLTHERKSWSKGINIVLCDPREQDSDQWRKTPEGRFWLYIQFLLTDDKILSSTKLWSGSSELSFWLHLNWGSVFGSAWAQILLGQFSENSPPLISDRIPDPPYLITLACLE